MQNSAPLPKEPHRSLVAPVAAIVGAALSLPALAATALLIQLPFFLAGLGSGNWFPLPSAANSHSLALAAIYGYVALFFAYWVCIAALTFQLARRKNLSRGTTVYCLVFASTSLAALYPWRFSDGTAYFHALAWPHVAYLLCLVFLAFRARADA